MQGEVTNSRIEIITDTTEQLIQSSLFHHPPVRSKIDRLHSHPVALAVSKCSTCLERFPRMSVKAISPSITECVRCTRTGRTGKLTGCISLHADNMDPGSVLLSCRSVYIIYSCQIPQVCRCILVNHSHTDILLHALCVTGVEKMLIAAVVPIMFMYRLPQGQYGYSGML